MASNLAEILTNCCPHYFPVKFSLVNSIHVPLMLWLRSYFIFHSFQDTLYCTLRVHVHEWINLFSYISAHHLPLFSLQLVLVFFMSSLFFHLCSFKPRWRRLVQIMRSLALDSRHFSTSVETLAFHPQAWKLDKSDSALLPLKYYLLSIGIYFLRISRLKLAKLRFWKKNIIFRFFTKRRKLCQK